VAVAFNLALTPGARGQATANAQVAAARADVHKLIDASGADAVGVVWRPLDASPGEEIRIVETVRFHAASTMKLPVMVELFRQERDGLLKLDDMVVVSNRFRSLADGSPYELSASADSDGETYKAIGQPMTLRALCETMITVSGNLAANVLIERLGVKNVQRTVEAIGAGGLQVLRGVEDQKAFDLGLNNTTDAAALATLLTAVARGDAVSRGASDAMLAMLKRQKFNDRIPAGLPSGIVVAHKTGEITRIQHDAAIVYARRPYVLVVLVRGLSDAKRGADLIAAISRRVFELAQEPGAMPK
jgi:beta-lactamase class A